MAITTHHVLVKSEVRRRRLYPLAESLDEILFTPRLTDGWHLLSAVPLGTFVGAYHPVLQQSRLYEITPTDEYLSAVGKDAIAAIGYRWRADAGTQGGQYVEAADIPDPGGVLLVRLMKSYGMPDGDLFKLRTALARLPGFTPGKELPPGPQEFRVKFRGRVLHSYHTEE